MFITVNVPTITARSLAFFGLNYENYMFYETSPTKYEKIKVPYSPQKWSKLFESFMTFKFHTYKLCEQISINSKHFKGLIAQITL